jgi:uncharacterized protein (TIGR03437 family)
MTMRVTVNATSTVDVNISQAGSTLTASPSIIVLSAVLGQTVSGTAMLSPAPPPATVSAIVNTPVEGSWLSVQISGAQVTATARAGSLPLGTYSGSVQVRQANSDSGGLLLSIPVSFTVTVPSLTITTSSLPRAIANAPYLDTTLQAINGTPPYEWSWTGNPSGLSLSSAGRISGTPTAVGSFTVAVTVRDSSTPANVTTKSFDLTVATSLTATPTQLTFTGRPGDTLASRSLAVAGGFDGSTATVAISPNTPWLTVTPAVSTLPSTLTVNANAAGQSAGRYTGSITITSSVAAVAPITVPVVMELGASPSLTLSPNPFIIHYRIGDPLPGQQVLSAFAIGSSLTVPVNAQFAGAPWLQATNVVGVNTPAAIPFKIVPAGIGVGTYDTKVTVSSTLASPNSVEGTIRLVVDPAPPSQVQISQSSLIYRTNVGGSVLRGEVEVSNPGGAASFSAQVTGCPCVRLVGTTSGTVSPTGAGRISYEMDPGVLPGAGSYFSNVRIHVTGSTTQEIDLPATLLVSGSNESIVLSQTGQEFIALQGSTTPITQQLSVLNGGTGSFPVSITPTTASNGNWLSVTPTSVSVTQGSPARVTVQVDPTGLPPGRYFGNIDFANANVGNSPQSVSIALTVVAPGTNIPPDASPSGFIFVSNASVPEGQQIRLGNLNAQPVIFNSTAITEDGAAWLQLSPPAGTLVGGGSTTGTLSVNIQGLKVGRYRGAVRIVFSDGTVREVPVLLHIVALLSSNAVESTTGRDARKQGCTTKELNATFEPAVLPNNFAVKVGQRITLEASVKDDCEDADPLSQRNANSTINVFVKNDLPGNKDTIIPMKPDRVTPEGKGIYTATWIPSKATPVGQQQTLVLKAGLVLGGGFSTTESAGNDTRVGVVSNGAPDIVIATAANSASQNPPSQASPGMSVTLKGQNLSDVTAVTLTNPPVKSGDVEVFLGGEARPIQYVSPGQINFLVPLQAGENVPLSVQVKRGPDSSQFFSLDLTNITPAIYTMNQQGFGQAAVLVANSDVIVGPPGAVEGRTSRAAARGEIIQIYCTGLGKVNNPPPPGQPASLTVLSETLIVPQVLIGGKVAPLGFSGLGPGLTGLYQINATIPADAPVGSSVEIQLQFPNGAVSNIGTIAVQ